MNPIVILLLLLSRPCLASAQATLVPMEPENIYAHMDVAFNQSDLPAVVAIAVDKAGERVVYEKGKAIWDKEIPVTADHLFRIASMTKLLTSIAAMQLVERNLLELDGDLSELMPEMASIPILQGDSLIPAEKPITLRHLLTHTAGFGYFGYTVDPTLFREDNWPYDDKPRMFESGTQFLYGTSTDWVGKLVEKVSGQSLDIYFKKHITGPLQMNRTFYNVPESLHHLIVSRGHRGEDGEQSLVEIDARVPAKVTETFSGGGGLFSTPNDYTKLLYCLLNKGEFPGGRILKEDTVNEMLKNQVGEISLNPGKRFSAPGSCCNFSGLMDTDSKWGLAFMIDNSPEPYGRSKGTVAWGGYYNTFFFIDFKKGIAASLYTQHIPFNHQKTTDIFHRFSELIYTSK
ncbi:serine hydrolase [Zeaxanthinibacter sp. PT1]|uniref:serine hydrolase domain-containing protein n=1 Tax=Zeaxanthinibacter TaxID=561554 RepID=UPI0023495227|nr:serine hydrolase domain-containing protein [Zeaxanthinibacter sp. PT1]MDC6350944.1 serine hydrolase [Zeaxanthinibacter sp. PT1]